MHFLLTSPSSPIQRCCLSSCQGFMYNFLVSSAIELFRARYSIYPFAYIWNNYINGSSMNTISITIYWASIEIPNIGTKYKMTKMNEVTRGSDIPASIIPESSPQRSISNISLALYHKPPQFHQESDFPRPTNSSNPFLCRPKWPQPQSQSPSSPKPNSSFSSANTKQRSPPQPSPQRPLPFLPRRAESSKLQAML